MKPLPALAGLALAAAIGTGVGWHVAKPKPVVETPAAQVKQDDGSIVLERKPDAKARPAHAVPKGAKVERVASVTVKPTQTGAGQGLRGSLKPAPDCPPVRVDLSLIRLPDQTRRVVASSPDGDVVAGMDIPVETAAPPPEPKKWAAGLSWSPNHQTAGAWVERDIGRVRLGAELNQTRPWIGGPSGVEARLRVGWAF